MTGGPEHSDRTVVVEGARIVAIGSASRVKVPKDARVVDAHGKFLIPGLWDMHVHIAGVNADPSWSKQILLPLLLAYGVTGVRDMGGDLKSLVSWKREIESGTLLGPHIVAAGPWLAASHRKTPEQFPVASEEDARAAVRELKQRGADFIKIITLPSKEVFFAVAGEAKKQNIPFVGHLPFQASAGEASNAGMRSIEHLLYSAFALSLSSREDELRAQLLAAEEKGDFGAGSRIMSEAVASYSSEKAAALWQTLKRNGTWVTPTLAALDTTAHPERWKADDPLLAYLPPDLASKWRGLSSDVEMKRRAAQLAERAEDDWRIAGEMHRASVPLLVGSDSLDPFVFPGESLHTELAQLVRAGFTPIDALQAATRDAAKFLGREQECGTIEIGKRADLVLLDANPTVDITNSRKIAAVIRDGNYLDRAALDGLLAKARVAAAATQNEK